MAQTSPDLCYGAPETAGTSPPCSMRMWLLFSHAESVERGSARLSKARCDMRHSPAISTLSKQIPVANMASNCGQLDSASSQSAHDTTLACGVCKMRIRLAETHLKLKKRFVTANPKAQVPNLWSLVFLLLCFLPWITGFKREEQLESMS